MRLFYAALALEANTFLPVPTSYQAFVEKLYCPPGKHPEKAGHQTGAIATVRAWSLAIKRIAISIALVTRCAMSGSTSLRAVTEENA